jgi:hypothetical protein
VTRGFAGALRRALRVKWQHLRRGLTRRIELSGHPGAGC